MSKTFRQIAQELFDHSEADWTDWEWDWLQAMRRLSRSPSEKERNKLSQLQWLNQSFSYWDGLAVEQMISICLPYTADFAESDADFVEALHKRGAKSVCRRELHHLIRLCKESGEYIAEDAA